MSIVSTIFYFAISCWMVTEAWITIRERAQAVKKHDQSSKLVIIICVVLAVYLSVTLAERTEYLIFGSKIEHLLLGTILICIGFCLRIWSVVTLGKFFRTTVMVQEKHVVISHGPYKYIRHPSYSGVLLATLGVGIGIGNWVSLLVLFSFIFIGLRYRISIEEKLLTKELGEKYTSYISYTKKLIPFIY